MKTESSNYSMLLTYLILLISLTACDRPECTNTNPIFEQYEPTSTVYKAELAKQLKMINSSKLSYWLEKYEEIAGQEYLFFYVQGDGLCASMELTVNQWEKLEKVRQKKGVSYRGAAFTQLQFEILQEGLNTSFVYKDFGRITD